MNFRNWLQIAEDKWILGDENFKLEMRSLSDAEILRAVQQGDESAMGMLLSRWEPKIKTYVNRRVRNPNDVEEIVQEALLNMVVALKGGTVPERFDSWTYTVAKNAIASYFRKKRLSTTDDPEGLGALQGSIRTGTTGVVIDNPQGESPLDIALRRERIDCVEKALQELAARGPLGKRDAAIVRDFYNGQKIAELTKKYDENIGTIKRILSVARKRLAMCLSDQGDVD